MEKVYGKVAIFLAVGGTPLLDAFRKVANIRP